jgi:hypothetical protein
MKTATLRASLMAALLLVGATGAFAQSDVTFQVDMAAAITNCALVPGEGQVSVVGSFNDWTTGVDFLTDDNSDGIYVGTVSIDDGDIVYKFYGTEPVGWENDPNREATIEGDVTLDVVAFNKDFPDLCSGPNYEVIFTVDMSVQILIGAFDPEVDQIFAAGEFQGWNATNPQTELFQNPFDPDFWTAVIPVALDAPSSNPYKYTKFVAATEEVAWEGGDNRFFEATGDETDSDGNGLLEIFVPVRYFDDVTPDAILTETATIRFEVDLRPAYYFLEDNDFLPADTQTGEPVTEINGLFVNGPVAGSSVEDTATDWATWGPEALGQIVTRQFFDDGTNGDLVPGDSIYTRIYTYATGTPKLRIGKFGVDGYDNEAGFGNDHHFRLTEGETVIEVQYGCILRSDGTYNDQAGPSVGDQDFTLAWDPYLVVDNEATPPTCVVVRSGGQTGVEPTGAQPQGFTLQANYPNPVVTQTTFEYSIPTASQVSLEVFDMMGRRVAVLVDDVQSANTYRVRFDTGELASGTYIYRLVAGEQVLTQRMTVIR